MAPPSIVFVGGCERSGTTLLARELARHVGATALPESMFLAASLPARGTELARRMSAHWRLGTWPAAQSELRARLSAARPDEAPIDVLRRLAGAIEGETGSGDERCGTLIDSSPWNLRLADRLRSAFPDAGFVHVVRDGRAVYSSVRRLEWGPSTPIRGAQWWMASVTAGLVAEASLGAPRVTYEELVADPAGVVGPLARQLGFSPLTRPLDDAAGLGEYTAHQHPLVAMPTDPSRADAWRRELPPQEAGRFEAEAACVLRALGYPAPDVLPPGLARQMGDDLRRAAHIVGRDGPKRLRRRTGLAVATRRDRPG